MIDIWEGIKSKENRVVVYGFSSVLVVIILIMSVIKNINGYVETAVYPFSPYNSMQSEHPGYESGGYLDKEFFCEEVHASICLPEEVNQRKDALVAVYEDITFLIMLSEDDMETLCTDTLPRMINTPIWGKNPKVISARNGSGYFYCYEGAYAAYTIKTQVSIKEIITYTICYKVDVGYPQFMYVYASVEDLDKVELANDILQQMVLSIETEEMRDVQSGGITVKEETEQILEESEKAYDGYLIDVYYEDLNAYDEGVLILDWENAECEPEALMIYTFQNQESEFMDEYSIPGHYVYLIGTTQGGNYQLLGRTKEQLTGCSIGIMERDDYEQLHAARLGLDSAHIREHED